MTPEGLRTVQASWRVLARDRDRLLAALERRFDGISPTPAAAGDRARWLFRAVEELVELLPAPSRLEVQARAVGESWPDPLNAPSYAIDGTAWMRAAQECVPSWSAEVESAWRQAWLLLSEVLAAETLSPFRDSEGAPDVA